jgi:autotransporter-associated beta strand protein
MRTPHTQSERKQTMPQAEIKNHGFFATVLGALLLFVVMAAPALAVDAVWLTTPGSGEWNTNGNWNPPTAPVNAGDMATFNTSTITSLFLSGNVTIDSMTFNPLASAFTIHTGFEKSFSFVGAGIVNNSGMTQTIRNTDGSTINFLNSSSAGNATIINTNTGSGAGVTNFHTNANAGNATIINEGGIFNFDGGGTTQFFEGSSARNATLIANGGSNGGFGGHISFQGDSDGGTARVEVFGNGSLDISLHNAPGVTVGSIEGDGNVFLGGNNLTVGTNNMSTLFSGVISDVVEGHANGSLTKVGTGTLTLTGVNDYTGITTINAGVLSISSDANLGIAPSPAPVANQLTFNGGTLQATASFALNPNRGITLLAGGGTIEVTGANTLSYAGSISGTGNLTKVGTGTQILSGSNSFTGTTFVNEGTLTLVDGISTGNHVIIGPLIIGDDVGATNTAIVIDSIGGAKIANSAPVTVNSDGLFEVDVGDGVTGFEDVGPLVINRGNVSVDGGLLPDSLHMTGGLISGAGAIALSDVTATSDASGNAATISARANLDDFSATVLTVNDGPASTDFLISGVLFDDQGTGIIKEGTGTLVLSGANTYTGITTIDAGILSISSDANLGTAPEAPVANQLTLNGGTLQVTASFDLDTNRGITLLGGGGTIGVTAANILSYGGVITGAGSLTKTDTGTLVLFGMNTYTGGTTISTGTLQLGNGGTSGSIVGDVLNNGTFAINRSDTFTFDGVISGSGAFAQIGTGTTVLTGANTYTGSTIVDGGTLLADGSLAAGSAVTVNSGATLGGTGTAAGAVAIADGGILAPGNTPGTPGTLTVGSLSLSNTSRVNYDLGTPGVIGSGVNDLTVVRGNLTLDGVLNTTALAGFGPGSYRLFGYGGALTDNTLDIGTVPAGFLASNFTIVTGLPNEVDLLVLAGPLPPSVQFWDGPNTRSNGVIDGGTGNWNNFTTNWTNASGNNNSFWRNGVAVFAGTAGTVTVTQPIFFAGMEFMTNGYQIDAATRGSLNLIGSPTITTDRGVTATINAALAGAGGITKEGKGTLILNGANTYLGNTAIDAGSLIVDGSIASAQTFVNAGGLLGGNGIIGGDLTNSGIVNPGRVNSPGTLTVAGNYTQTAGGTLRIEIAGTAPGQFDLLRVGGHASLAGTLQLIRLGNFQLQVGDKIAFLTAQGGVSGTFSTILNPFVTNTLIKADINILGNAVQLEGTQGSFTEVACNSNTAAVGGALNSAVGDPGASGLIGFLDTQPLSEICGDLELISPDEVTAVFNIAVSLANVQSVNLERRMDDIQAGSRGFSAAGFAINTRGRDFNMGLAGPTGPEGKSGPSVMQPTPQNRWGVFVTGLGEFTTVDSTSNAPGFDLTTGGVTFGADYRVSPNFAIGLMGGYAHTNADLVNNGSLDVNGGTIGAYATAFGGGFYIDGAATGIFNGYDEHRTALLGTASGDTDGRDFNALVAAGYDWKSGGLTIGPTASYQYTYVEVDGFTETGSLAPLTFSDQNAHSSRTALGAKASYDWHVGHVVVKPEVRAAWQHEFGDTDYSVVSRFASGAGNSFTVNGPAIGRDSLLIGAGAAVIFNDRVSVYAYYDGELARTNYSSNNVSAGVRVSF